MSYQAQHPSAPAPAGGDEYRADGRADALDEALAGVAVEQQKAAGAAANAAASLSPREKRIAALNAPNSDLYSDDPARHAAALAELKRLLAADPEAQSFRADATVDELRDFFNLPAPKFAAPVSNRCGTRRARRRSSTTRSRKDGIRPSLRT
jgi:hypothetical protein